MRRRRRTWEVLEVSERVELKDVGISSTRRKKGFFEKTKSHDLQVPTTLFPYSFEVLAKRGNMSF